MSKRAFRCMLSLLLGLVLLSGMVLVMEADVQAMPSAPPSLVNRYPPPNVFTTSLDSLVWAAYDQSIDPVTVNYRSFAVHAMQTGWLSETLAVNNGTMVLTPTASLHPGELVQVSATTATLNLQGEGPLAPTVWQFWAGVEGGTATFEDSGQRLGMHDNRGLALGDLDGDGDLDAFVGAYNSENQVYHNDGSGIFSLVQFVGSQKTLGIALGDLDGDGDLDAFEANVDNEPDRIWWNDGAGLFTDSGQALGSQRSFFPALGDVDGDGDLDAFVPNGGGGGGMSGQANKVYLNDGAGLFSDSGQDLGLGQSVGAALGDLDGDGDLDAFVANGGYFPGANRVWVNDGRGLFTDSGQALGLGESLTVALGDLDGDGDLDAYVTNFNSPSGQADEVWINDGDGTFSLGQAVGNAASAGGALGDLDDDGDLDALTCTFSGAIVWLNDGSGQFAGDGQTLNDCTSLALGDLDGDGDLDVFTANTVAGSGAYPNEVWLNDPVITVAPAAASQSGAPGETVTYTLQVTNTGSVQDTYTVTVASEWAASAPTTIGPLAPGTGTSMTVTVTIPLGGNPGESDVAIVVVTSQWRPIMAVAAQLTTFVLSYERYLPIIAGG